MGTKNEDEMNEIMQMLFNTKIKDLPKSFYWSKYIGDYYMYVRTFYSDPPEVYVDKKDGCGRDSIIKIKDPDPNATVGDLFNRAKMLIETSINKNCTRP